MKAIVLAAGAGGRMRPLTDHLHKSLVPVGNSTILGRIVDGLIEIDVRDILVVTGYRADQVKGFLGERYPWVGFEFVHNERYRETNNIVSLAMALEVCDFETDVILIECDVLFETSLLRRLNNEERGNIALVDRYRPGMDGTVVSVENGVITSVYPPHLQTEDFDYRDKYKTVNIYRFDREFCRNTLRPLLSCYANVIDSGCYYELVLGMLINMQREVVRAEVVDGSEWVEVDDPNDLAVARFAFEPDQRSKVLSRNFGGLWNFDVLDFTFMRNMYFPTDAMIAAMRRALPTLVVSYGSAQPVLNEKLAYVLRCHSDRIQCLHGAGQVFPMLSGLLGVSRALIPAPTFGEFPRWFPKHELYWDTVGVDCAELGERARDFDLVVVVSPNNPTGTTLSTACLHAMIARCPGTTFLVDESFQAFSTEKALLDRLEEDPLDNVIVIASLSKTLGVPGLRLGYAYSCDPEKIRKLGAQVPIWNLGSMAEFFLELFLKFAPEWNSSIARSVADRKALQIGLAEVPGVERVYPSGGNFLLARLQGSNPANAARVVEDLLARHSIYVKDVSAKFPEAAPYLRVAVRRPAENLKLLTALGSALAEVRN